MDNGMDLEGREMDRNMITPQQKAQELIMKFSSELPYYTQNDNIRKSKKCAMIAVDEIITVIDDNIHNDVSGLLLKQHWGQVREELQSI